MPAFRYSGRTTIPDTQGERSRMSSSSNSRSWTVPTARLPSTATHAADVGERSRLSCSASASHRARLSSVTSRPHSCQARSTTSGTS
jgi:hypothetical protein